jgi:cytidylate kinase
MITQRTLRLLSKLASRDLASAESKAADAQAKVQMLEREATLINGYTRQLMASLRDRACLGRDFKATTGFVAASLKARATTEAARQQGEQAKLAAFDRLAAEIGRRDALDTAHEAVAAETARSQERKTERLSSPSSGVTSKQ